jgi:type VI secretion system protein ImpA
MAVVDREALAQPLSETDPCGPDLDLGGDPEYMNFVAKAENLLPLTFFDREGKPFDRSRIAGEFDAIKPLLARTRDIRLLVILAKLCVLNRDLAGFAAGVGAIGALLERSWDDLHPRGDNGDFAARMAPLETLDDLPTVVLPLQYVPLIEDRRLGAIRYRTYLFACGEAQPREGEEVHDAAAIERALGEVELPVLVETRGRFEGLQAALVAIKNACLERAGATQAPRFDKLLLLVGRILAFLNDAIVKRDPSAARVDPAEASVDVRAGGVDAPVPPAVVSGGPIGRVRSSRDAAAALHAAADYFSRSEPSNPALLLVRQAEQLMGKSFLDVMRILVPEHVEKAKIVCGKELGFELPIEKLSTFSSGVESPQSAAFNGPDASPGSQPTLEANTRQEAIALLEQTGAYYRTFEPSSPVPFLTERARDLAQRDFLSLLKDLLPESAIKITRE